MVAKCEKKKMVTGNIFHTDILRGHLRSVFTRFLPLLETESISNGADQYLRYKLLQLLKEYSSISQT